MDTLKGSELGRRSLRIANSFNANKMKPLGVCNSQSSFDRKSLYDCVQKSPTRARKSLFEVNCKENDYAICKEFSSDRENTGKSPIVVPKNPNGSQEQKKIKPRRSMLGLRSKAQLNIVKDDTTFTISKPLLTSSPNRDERMDGYSYGELKPLSQRSISTPQLTPFDSDDVDTSAFFNKGMSESTWSVFKSVKKKSAFETPVARGSVVSRNAGSIIAAPENNPVVKNNGNKGAITSGYHDSIKTRSQRSSLISCVDKEVKLKWLAQKFQMQEKKLPHASGNDNSIMDIKEENHSYESSSENGEVCEEGYYQEDQMNNTLTHSLQPSISPIDYNDEDDVNESANSTDSYIQNETTILNSVKNNLEKIEEENIDNMPRECISDEESNDKANGNDLRRIVNLFEDLENEKKDLDSKLNSLMEQKEVFEKKWKAFSSMIYSLNPRSLSQRNSLNFSSGKKETKSITKTKFRNSLVLNPKMCSTFPKPSNVRPIKTYSEIKTNLISCKTPVSSEKTFRRLRKSTCYTPNSLSIMVDDQAKDIFGEV